MAITLRKATLDDVPQIEALIARSARGLSTGDYRPSQVEGALRAAFGIGTLLLEHCEKEARAHGYSQVELMATLPGVKLYAARGYLGAAKVNFDLGLGETIEFIPMRKALVTP